MLDIGECPYPSLTDASEDREMCRLEEQMISEADVCLIHGQLPQDFHICGKMCGVHIC